jgi:hypothetical protein
MDERMGHLDGSIQGRYDHVSGPMRRKLMGDLTSAWEAALDARLALCPSSPVGVLNALLRARERETHRAVKPVRLRAVGDGAG